MVQDFVDDGIECPAEDWKAVLEQQAQVDAFSAVIKLTLINSQARCFGERFWKAIIIEEMIQFRRSERENRVIDHDQEGSMELKKREGYF